MKEIPLFTINLFEFTCDSQLTELVYNEILELDKSKKINWNNNDSNLTYVGYFGENNNLFYHNQHLYSWFQECIDQVANKIYKKQLKIVDSWITKTNFLHSSVNHTHKFSVLSGVFYFTESSQIEFEHTDPAYDYLTFFYTSEEKNDFTSKSRYSPTFGKLILFSSDLPHRVLVNKDKQPRYSIAFNTFFDGVLSENVAGKLKINTSDVCENPFNINVMPVNTK